MTNDNDLIPRDAAIAAVYHADSFELSLCGTSRIEERIELIPTIAPAAIREAALKEAAKAVDALPDAKSPDVNIGVANAYAAILALIGEKK